MRIPTIALSALVLISSTSATDKARLLIQRIGPLASTIYIANADGSSERQLPAMQVSTTTPRCLRMVNGSSLPRSVRVLPISIELE